MVSLTFAQFWLALIVGALWGLLVWRRKPAAFPYPNLQLFGIRDKDWRQSFAKLMRGLGVVALLLALARPQLVRWEEVRTEGIDIVITLDISGSMTATDFLPNRMEAAKRVIRNFVELLRQKRSGDRLGLVVFAAESYTQCPLTDDYDFFLEALDQVQNAREGVVEDGTAIGDGLTVALRRLQSSPAKSKVVILLSDGMNNAGQVQPRDAARIAGAMGIRVYTIGIGTSTGTVSWQDPLTGRTHIGRVAGFDEPLLREIAQRTDGAYFYAADRTTLESILRYILQLETTPLVVRKEQKRTELAVWLIAVALACLLMESLFVHALWRRVP
ncbi:MAG: VWA domain-containing protein [Armatimonadetes bacterium]|nr:VWA domain-containing protein [Armatimonadota bacterium]MCX7967469.1 VWA domain-containing protein [Armatimonadota bacterium]MDW8143511.1 VWA domain-containing protein [Armatimonadota bacterium]